MGIEFGVPIRDNTFWHTMELDDLLEVQMNNVRSLVTLAT